MKKHVIDGECVVLRAQVRHTFCEDLLNSNDFLAGKGG
jgi:hypothetical protein